jgi:hypothetical protein
MLRSYALAPETIRRLLRRAFWRFQIIAALSFLGFGLYLAFQAHPVDWGTAGPMVALIALVYFVIIFYNFRQQLRLFYSERYELDDSSITYRQGKHTPVRISRADITQAQQSRDGIIIATANPRTQLFIPLGLAREGDVDFRNTLQAWVEMQPFPSQPRTGQWIWIGTAAITFLILVFANNFGLVLGLGIFLILFGILIDRKPDFLSGIIFTTSETNLRRTYNLAISFLIFVVLMKSCLLGFTVFAQAAR